MVELRDRLSAVEDSPEALGCFPGSILHEQCQPEERQGPSRPRCVAEQVPGADHVPGAGVAARAALAVVAGAGIAAAAVIVALPRLAGSKRALRFRLGRWLSPRTTSLHRATQAWAFVFCCWLVRGIACFIMLGTLGLGYSFPLALLFLCAGAAAAALPIGLAGAATQVGIGTAALATSGIGTSQALAASVSVGALGVFSGAAVLLFAVGWRTGGLLLSARTQRGVDEVVNP